MPPSDIVQRMQAAATALEGKEVGARETLLDLNRELQAELETPTDFVQRIWFATASLAGCLEIAVNAKVFQYLEDSPDGISTETLAEKTGITVPLLARFMRHFAAHRIVSYSKDKGWQPTPLSKTLAQENYQHSILFCHRAAAASFIKFPEHFSKSGYTLPTAVDGPFQYSKGSAVPFFDWLVTNPPYVDWFASFMSVYRAGNVDWWAFYPAAERLAEAFDKAKSETFLVDVGGGRGHDLASFASGFSVPGKLVLQDKPEVVAGVQGETPYEAQAHDFFTPQPVRGARAYFLHSIIHDWGDENGVKILQNLVPALLPGYSRVLLNEIVLFEEQPSVPATAMDMMMLGHLSDSRERTEAEWRGIASKAGLEVTAVYSNPASPESVIELGLPAAQ